jgi:hypothetical protein
MVEPVFAHTKFNRRCDRFLRRGRSACRSEWRLINATHNLLKLHKHTSRPRPPDGRRRVPGGSHTSHDSSATTSQKTTELRNSLRPTRQRWHRSRGTSLRPRCSLVGRRSPARLEPSADRTHPGHLRVIRSLGLDAAAGDRSDHDGRDHGEDYRAADGVNDRRHANRKCPRPSAQRAASRVTGHVRSPDSAR